MNTGTMLFKHASGSHSKTLNVALWVAQVLLALVFGMAGTMKLIQPLADLAISMPWTIDVSGALVRFIGFMELAGAIGVLVPALTRIMPSLTSWAALGLCTIMVLATGFHMTRGEMTMAPVPVILGIVAGFVAWGRTSREPILPVD